MKKIFLNSAGENWIVDRFKDEWLSNNSQYATNDIKSCDILWVIAPWNLNNIPKKYLKNKMVVCTIHHIDTDKFKRKERRDFYYLDKFVDQYHTISNKNVNILKNYTDKNVTPIPFWIDSEKFFYIEDKVKLLKSFGLNNGEFLIGSFQRDTEKKGNMKPKLSKGPDQFLEIVKKTAEEKNVRVILTGKRRGYLIKELEKLNIKYSYFEMINLKILNQLYNILDLYIVASRVEGGPASILECGASKTPIISTDVGMASQILPSESIFDMNSFESAVPNVQKTYKNTLPYFIPHGFNKFIEYFNNL